MFFDLIVLAGLVCFVAGVYLWLDLPAALIVLGAFLMFVGVRLGLRKDMTNEPGNAIIRNEQQID
jgi:hypothetical protein